MIARKRLAAISAAAVAVACLGIAPCQSAPKAADPVLVIDTAQTTTNSIFGLGVQWDPFDYSLSHADWKTIIARMDFCQPACLRVMINAHDYCAGFKPDGTPKYIWLDGTAAQRKSFACITQIVDYAQSRGIDVILGEWSPPHDMMADAADPRWPQMSTALVSYLRNKRGDTVVRYYNLINEPNGDWSGNKNYASWAAAVKALRNTFDAHGLAGKVRIIGPDTTGNTKWMEPFTWLDRAAREMPHVIGAWDLHWYATDQEVHSDAIEKTLSARRQVLKAIPGEGPKPRFIGESGILTGKINGDQQPRVRSFEYGVLMADYIAQVLRAGWGGAVAWDMDDAMHVVDWKHRPDPPDATTLKLWGFWNSQGARMGNPADFKPRPWFYTWSLMSRLFPRGAQIVGTAPLDLPNFRTAAAVRRSGTHQLMSIMLVNDADTPRTITLRVPGHWKHVTRYSYFASHRPATASGLAKADGVVNGTQLSRGIRVPFEGRGVIFFSAEAAPGSQNLMRPIK